MSDGEDVFGARWHDPDFDWDLNEMDNKRTRCTTSDEPQDDLDETFNSINTTTEKQNDHVQQTLKRLSLIQTSIELDDTDIIILQVAKLESLEPDDEVVVILQKLERLEYASALQAIEVYLTKYKGVVAYINPEVKGLKLELKMLEQKLQDLDALKNEQLSTIEEFNTLYSLKVGDIIEKILKRKKELLAEQVAKMQERFEQEKERYEETKSKAQDLEAELKDLDEFDDEYDDLYEAWQEAKEEENTQRKKVKEAKDELEEDEEFQEYEEVKEEYEEFHREYEEVLKQERFELNDEEKKELKKLFRKAARLCHPDIVTKELQDQAHEITSQLNEAYAQKDLSRVKKIVDMLENGVYFDTASDKLENVEKLKHKITELREKVATVTEELKAIKKDETFNTIEEINDWDTYFNEVRENLEKEYRALQNIENEQDETKTAKSKEKFDEDDDYWEEPF